MSFHLTRIQSPAQYGPIALLIKHHEANAPVSEAIVGVSVVLVLQRPKTRYKWYKGAAHFWTIVELGRRNFRNGFRSGKNGYAKLLASLLMDDHPSAPNASSGREAAR